MFIRTMISVSTALLVTACLAPVPAQADEVVRVSGGGTATFDFFEGGTIFSVEAEIDGDGDVRGHFFCAIPSIVVINGNDLVEAIVHDDGSVELYGFAHGYDVAVGVFEDMPFAVRLWGGPAGTARFIYDDPVVGPSGGVDLDEGDHETVQDGHIFIR